MTAKAKTFWTFAITAVARVHGHARQPRRDDGPAGDPQGPHASLESLEWTVNAYTLTFAVLLLTGAALGDRFGRRRMFAIGLGIFTLASIAAALAPNVEVLNIARAVQGLGGAIVMPLTLTILSAGVPKDKRGVSRSAPGAASAASRSRSARSSAAPSSQGFSWQWIFWLNVPIGIVLCRWRSPG